MQKEDLGCILGKVAARGCIKDSDFRKMSFHELQEEQKDLQSAYYLCPLSEEYKVQRIAFDLEAISQELSIRCKYKAGDDIVKHLECRGEYENEVTCGGCCIEHICKVETNAR